MARGQRYEPDSILSFDRAYVDYHWFDQLHRQGVYFVTRQKRNARYRVLERRSVVPQPGVTSDQVIRLTGKAAQWSDSPARDPETRQFYVFLPTSLSSHGGGGGRRGKLEDRLSGEAASSPKSPLNATVEIALSQLAMQIQLWNQVSDLLRPFGIVERHARQYPAFKTLF